jgi:hypothetical protein
MATYGIVEHLTDEELNNFEKRIKHGRILKIEEIDKDTYQDIPFTEGLIRIFSDLNSHQTLYAKTNAFQCYGNRRRSQKDLYNIVRYYYPNISFKEFRASLFTLVNNRRIGTFYCSDIRKRVFRRNSYGLGPDPYNHSIMCESRIDELGLCLATTLIR